MEVKDRSRAGLWITVGILLLIFAVRLIGIDRFPIFIDETIHIHTQEQILETSPLIGSEIGRMGTVWWLFLFQPHRGDAIWIARTAVLIAVLPGIAALMALGRMASGNWGLLFVGLFALFSTYHYFFDRMALADPVAGSLVMIAIFFSYRLRYRVYWQDAALCGFTLFLAIVAKINVLPYLGIPLAAVVGFRHLHEYRHLLKWLSISLASLLIPTVILDRFLVFTGHSWLFAALSYIESRSGGNTDFGSRIIGNAADTMRMVSGYMHPVVFALLCLGMIAALFQRRWYWLLVFFAPLLSLWIGEPQETRYWIVPVALLGLIGSVVLADAVRNRPVFIRSMALLFMLLWGGLNWLPFIILANRSPADLNLPQVDRRQYILSDAVGFGFEQIPDLIPAHEQVLGILANCQGLRYTFLAEYDVRCTQINPNGEDISTIIEWVEINRPLRSYAVLEDSAYLPDSIEGEIIGRIERPGGRATLTIYHVTP